MNEEQRLLKLQNAVKMMIADGQSSDYIDRFLASQNSSPEEIAQINEYGASNMAKARTTVQQIDKSRPSNSLAANLLSKEALMGGLESGLLGVEDVLNAATAGGYDWINEKIGGNYKGRKAEYNQMLEDSPRWLRTLGQSGQLMAEIGGALRSPIYGINLLRGAGTTARLGNMMAQAGIYGGIRRGFEDDSVMNVPTSAIGNALFAGATGGLMMGIPAGIAKATGISSGVGAETMDLARRAGLAGGESANAFKAGRQATALDIANDLDDAYRAVDRQAKEAFSSGKKAIESVIIDKNALTQGFKDWKKANFTPYGRKNLATPEEQKVYNQANRMLKKFAKRKGDMILGEGHSLKNAIGNIAAERGSAAERVRTSLYNLVRDNLNKTVPEYASLTKPYAEAKDALLAVKQATGEAGREMTNFQKSNITKRLVAALKTPSVRESIENVAGSNLTNKLAGYATKSLVPESGISRLGAAALLANTAGGNIQSLAVLPSLSPRLSGNLAYGIGRAQSLAPSVEKIMRSIQDLDIANKLVPDFR